MLRRGGDKGGSPWAPRSVKTANSTVTSGTSATCISWLTRASMWIIFDLVFFLVAMWVVSDVFVGVVLDGAGEAERWMAQLMRLLVNGCWRKKEEWAKPKSGQLRTIKDNYQGERKEGSEKQNREIERGSRRKWELEMLGGEIVKECRRSEGTWSRKGTRKKMKERRRAAGI